jgi:hypothetical protein
MKAAEALVADVPYQNRSYRRHMATCCAYFSVTSPVRKDYYVARHSHSSSPQADAAMDRYAASYTLGCDLSFMARGGNPAARGPFYAPEANWTVLTLRVEKDFGGGSR